MFFNLPTLLTWARIVAIPLIIGVFYFAINTLIEYAGKKLSKKLNYLQKAKR